MDWTTKNSMIRFGAKCMWSLFKRKEVGGALTNTMILALHCANRTRLYKLFVSVKTWFDEKQQDPMGSKLKG